MCALALWVETLISELICMAEWLSYSGSICAYALMLFLGWFTGAKSMVIHSKRSFLDVYTMV